MIRICSLLTCFLNSLLLSHGRTCRPEISSMYRVLQNDVLLQHCISDVLSELTAFHVETRGRLSCKNLWCYRTPSTSSSSVPQFSQILETCKSVDTYSARSFILKSISSLILLCILSLLCLFPSFVLSNIQGYLMEWNVDFSLTHGTKKCVSRVWIMKRHNTQNNTHPFPEYIHWGATVEVMPMKKEAGTVAYVFRAHSAWEISEIIHMYEF